MSSDIELRVKKLIEDKLDVTGSQISLKSSFIEDFKADSLDMVELVMEVEKEFGIPITDDRAAKIKTIEDLVKYIEEHSN